MFGITEAEKDAQFKDLAGKHGFDVHTDLRQFIANEMAAAGKAVTSGSGAITIPAAAAGGSNEASCPTGAGG